MIKLSAFSDEAAKSLDGQIAALNRNRIAYTELRSIDGKNVADFTIDEAKEYKKQLDEGGVKVWSIGSPLGKVDISADIDEYLGTVAHVCELANVFETDKIRAFSFYGAYDSREKVIDNMNRMAECAEKYGVTLYHENEKDIYGDTLARVLDLMENVKGWKFIYDPANFIQTGEDPNETVPGLRGKIDYYHVKDVIAETQEIVPAGYGDGQIGKIIAQYDGDTTFTLEPHLRLFDGYGAIDATDMKNRFVYRDNTESFDAAVTAFKKLLGEAGYRETGIGTYEK